MRPTSALRAAASLPKRPLPPPAAGPSRPARPAAPAAPLRKSPLPKALATPLRNNAQAQAQRVVVLPADARSQRLRLVPGSAAAAGAADPPPSAVKDKSIWQSYLALDPKNKTALGIVLFVFAGIAYTMQFMVPEETEEPVETVFERKARKALGAGAAQRAGAVEQIERRPS